MDTTLELTDAEVEALGRQGYFVRPALLGPARAREVARAARERAGALVPAGIRRGADHTVDARVRGDRIGWVTEQDAGALGALWRAFAELGQALNRGAYLGLGRFDLQLALYPGEGTFYARHRDAFPGQSNRRATAIWYANEGWAPEHGGRLRLFPEGAAPVEVDPALDTLVVFLAERLEHEVLPAHAPRLALTAWYYGPGR